MQMQEREQEQKENEDEDGVDEDVDAEEYKARFVSVVPSRLRGGMLIGFFLLLVLFLILLVINYDAPFNALARLVLVRCACFVLVFLRSASRTSSPPAALIPVTFYLAILIPMLLSIAASFLPYIPFPLPVRLQPLLHNHYNCYLTLQRAFFAPHLSLHDITFHTPAALFRVLPFFLRLPSSSPSSTPRVRCRHFAPL
jgi:hypothetical protein